MHARLEQVARAGGGQSTRVSNRSKLSALALNAAFAIIPNATSGGLAGGPVASGSGTGGRCQTIFRSRY